ncbi:unnamed protein product [Ectocarpus sp. 6 AP-2014]
MGRMSALMMCLPVALSALAFSTTTGDALVSSAGAGRWSGGHGRHRLQSRSSGWHRVAVLGKVETTMINAAEAFPADASRFQAGGASGGGVEDAGKIKGGRVSRIWGRYLHALENRPLLTKSLSSGVISGTANLIEQTLSPAAFSLVDWTAFTLVGAVFIGTVLHHWYGFLDRMGNSEAITSRIKSKWGRIVLQVVLDQTIGASLVNSGYFACHTVCLAGLTGRAFPLPELGSSIVEKVTSRYVVMMMNNFRLWPWVSFVNFAFIPADLRVLVSNFVAVLWGYLMSKWCR